MCAPLYLVYRMSQAAGGITPKFSRSNFLWVYLCGKNIHSKCSVPSNPAVLVSTDIYYSYQPSLCSVVLSDECSSVVCMRQLIFLLKIHCDASYCPGSLEVLIHASYMYIQGCMNIHDHSGQ